MPSTFSSSLRLTLQATGENLSVWGAILNSGVFQLVDSAVAGRTGFSLSGTKTLTSSNGTSDEARQMFLDITSGSGGTVTIPAVNKLYLVRNAASGDAIFTTGSGISATVASANVTWIVCDGTNVRLAFTSDFQGAVLTNVGTPLIATDASNKGYSDANLAAAIAYADSLSFASGNLPGGQTNGFFLRTDGVTPFWGASAGTWVGPVTGDVTGNLTGNVTGVVTGSLIGNASTSTSATTAGTATFATSAGTAGSATTATTATTAGKWTTTRTISLTGDVTGSQSIDGSGNISIAATLANPRVVARALINGATGAVVAGFNVASVSHPITGLYVLTFSSAVSSANYTATAAAEVTGNDTTAYVTRIMPANRSTTTVGVFVSEITTGGTVIEYDPTFLHVEVVL